MEILLWILAVLSLLGGLFLAIEEDYFVWLIAGLVSFAMLGGFASVISSLKGIQNTLNIENYTSKEIISLLKELKSDSSNVSSNPPTTQIAENDEEIPVI